MVLKFDDVEGALVAKDAALLVGDGKLRGEDTEAVEDAGVAGRPCCDGGGENGRELPCYGK